MRYLLMAACVVGMPRAWPVHAAEFELRDGDRIVLLGNTFIERDQTHSYLETLLTAANPDKTFLVRNLGWSGDTVTGIARAGFGTPDEGFRQLKEHVLGLKPTVLLVAYGSNEAFEGPQALPRFTEDLERLLHVLAETQARIVLLGPLRQEDLGPPLPDPAHHNADLKRYRAAIESVASRRGLRFLDLFGIIGAIRHAPAEALTDNGIHLTARGYWLAALAIAKGLGLERPSWEVVLDRQVKVIQARGTELTNDSASAAGLQFEAKDYALPVPPPPDDVASPGSVPGRVLKITGLSPGRYRLQIDGETIVAATAGQWADGVQLSRGPDLEQVERLRQTIIRKNVLYFHRWRPQNETYLFGFRKHEQGQNAREIPLFDPLVAEQEAEIARLRRPVAHRYELKLESEVQP